MKEWIILKHQSKRWFVLHYHICSHPNTPNNDYWWVYSQNNYICDYSLHGNNGNCNKQAPDNLIKLIELLNFMAKI